MLPNMLTINQQKILEALLNGEISLSGLARKTFLAKARVFGSLKELEEKDWVRKREEGRTHLYRLNTLDRELKERLRIIVQCQSAGFNRKTGGLPEIVDAFLRSVLKEKYLGCIFFGSSLTEKRFQDIDFLVISAKRDKTAALIGSIKRINSKLSPIIIAREEIEKGLLAEDMLYKNVIRGLPFSCIEWYLRMKFLSSFLRREDIEERFIIGLREIISCQEFQEEEYVQRHLDKGIMDVIYAYLNYFDLFPLNDTEAKKIFKGKTKLSLPSSVKKAKAWTIKLGLELK